MASNYSNKRLRRPKQQILEVSIRHDKEREIVLRRTLAISVRILLAVGILVGAVLGGRYGLRRFLWQNPAFYLTDVRVSKDGTLTREQILAAGDVKLGVNIFTVDANKVRAGIAHLPQVERVEVRRSWPHRLDIEVTERLPIAWVMEKSEQDPTAPQSKALLIDARGYVMRGRDIPHEYFNLPSISGVMTENLAPGQKVNSLEMQAALDLVRLNSDSTRWQVRNIDLTKGYCLIVTDRSHAQITFGLDDVDRQLGRLNRLLDYLEPAHKEIQTVNLLVERNTPVTFVDSNQPPANEPPVVNNPPPATPSSGATPPPSSNGKAHPASDRTASKKPGKDSKTASAPKHNNPAPATSKPSAAKGKEASPKKLPPENVRKPFLQHG